MSPRTATFHAGLTPELIVDAAMVLTQEQHLFGWSLRDLARRLEVAPSVIYHHVGGKELLARHIVERVLSGLTPPAADLAWDAWFRELLYAAGPQVARYPGCATWLLMHGPTFPVVMPIIDTGIAALQRAGFGELTGLAYAALLNNAVLTISLSDERLRHEDDGPRDHAAMMEEFHRAGADSPGVTALTQTLLSHYLQGDEPANDHRRIYYRFIVDTTIAGLTAQLGTGIAHRS